jgi:hypothetical protein
MYLMLHVDQPIFPQGNFLTGLVVENAGDVVARWEGDPTQKSLILYERFFTITKTRAFPIDAGE